MWKKSTCQVPRSDTTSSSVRVSDPSTTAWSRPCTTPAKVRPSVPLGYTGHEPPSLEVFSLLTSLLVSLGDTGMKEYTARTTRKPPAGSGPPQTLRDHLRIYFPTEQTVASSRGGRGVREGQRTMPSLPVMILAPTRHTCMQCTHGNWVSF